MIPQVPIPEGPVLLDGGMGQELVKRIGGEVGTLWSAEALICHPELVQEVHEEFIRAGSQIITTNTYSLGRPRLEKADYGDRFEELNRMAANVAIQARDNVGTGVLIAGALPPYGESFRPDLVGPYTTIRLYYREQAKILAPYVDFFLCETMSSTEEAFAAVAGASAFDKPIWVSWTLADQGLPTLRSGESIAEAHAMLKELPVSAFLVNCCSPEQITLAMPELLALSDWPVGGLANGFRSIPNNWQSSDGLETLGKHENLDEAIYASHVNDWLIAGARIVGGCCEIGPGYIARLRQMLDNDWL